MICSLTLLPLFYIRICFPHRYLRWSQVLRHHARIRTCTLHGPTHATKPLQARVSRIYDTARTPQVDPIEIRRNKHDEEHDELALVTDAIELSNNGSIGEVIAAAATATTTPPPRIPPTAPLVNDTVPGKTTSIASTLPSESNHPHLHSLLPLSTSHPHL